MVTAEQKLRTDIEAACPGIPVRAFGVVPSLEEEALLAAGGGERGPLILSALRSGEAEKTQDVIWAHLCLIVGEEGAMLPPVTLKALAAAACAMAIERLASHKTAIRWPGDVLIGGRVASRIAVRCGSFEPSIALVSASVNICGGEEAGKFASLNAPYLAPGRLVGEIARGFFSFLRQEDRACMESYRDRCTALEQEIRYEANGERHTGRVMGVDDDGALIVLSRSGAPHRLEDESSVISLFEAI